MLLDVNKGRTGKTHSGSISPGNLVKKIRHHRYDPDRGHVEGVDNGHQARQNEHAEGIIAGRSGRLGCQPAPPEGAGQAVADLDLRPAIDVVKAGQPAEADYPTVRLMNNGPQSTCPLVVSNPPDTD